jgi:hypothetical protein
MSSLSAESLFQMIESAEQALSALSTRDSLLAQRPRREVPQRSTSISFSPSQRMLPASTELDEEDGSVVDGDEVDTVNMGGGRARFTV